MAMAMARWVVVVFAVVVSACLTSTAVGRTLLQQPYEVTGTVYCDTCRCGFETTATTYIPGAIVELRCMDKSDSRQVYSTRTTTDQTGRFTFVEKEDHGDQDCDVVLVSSPWKHCRVADPGRNRSRVIVTDFNGITSYRRHANALGFFQDYSLPQCAKLLNYYLHSDDE